MIYAKLDNGVLTCAPSTLTIDGRVHYHPPVDLYVLLGYLPVVDTPYPEIPEGTDPVPYYVSHWEALDGQIVKVWTEGEPPVPEAPSPTLEDRVVTLEGETSELYGAINMILEGVVDDETGAEAENPAV